MAGRGGNDSEKWGKVQLEAGKMVMGRSLEFVWLEDEGLVAEVSTNDAITRDQRCVH